MNFTHEIVALRQRVDELDAALEVAIASLNAAGIANHVIVRTLLSRLLTHEASWETALGDLADAAAADLAVLPIAGEAAEQVRAFAHCLLNGTFNSIGDAHGGLGTAGQADRVHGSAELMTDASRNGVSIGERQRREDHRIP
jgi:hypothetical protein